MSIWNKVLIGLVVVASMGYFYLGLQTLKTHQYWRSSVNAHEKKIKSLLSENENLIDGDQERGEPGIRRLQMELYKILVNRGRVWYNCTPEKVVDPRTGAVRVSVDFPDPHGITAKMVVQVIQQRDPQQKDPAKRGHFLGEFTVRQVDQKQVGLEPSMKMAPEQLKRLLASKGFWTLYEIMPADDHEVFAALKEEDLSKILPADSVQEYVNDTAETPRKLRDYHVLLKEFHRQRSVLIDAREAAIRDKQFIDATLADTREQERFRRAEITALEAELAQWTRQRDAVAGHLGNLETALTARQERIKELIDENLATAGLIAKIQLEATRRIDRRIRDLVNAVGEQ